MRGMKDIAIIGAGPVGLTLALLLSRAGRDVVVLEAAPALPDELRASTFHPPTLDMLDRLGLAAPLIAAGLVTPRWQIRWHETGEHALFDLSVLAGETAHPYRLQAEQQKLCALLLAALPAGVVRFGAAVESLVQDDDGVTLSGAAVPPLRAGIAVGCDGARSVVRGAISAAFEGDIYPETTLLATTTFGVETVMPGLSNVNYFWTANPAFDGTFALLRVPGRWRMSLYPAPGETPEDAMQPEALRRKLVAIHPAMEDAPVAEIRPYRVHKRLASRYRHGRLFLAGDAAHLNSPSGGMGMNGGIHDAFELADTLLSGADPDRYERRRRPVAEHDIIAQADRNRARMRQKDPAARRAALAELQAVCAESARMKAHLMNSSMINGLRAAATRE
jgi:3-(3-hydroxy-phenyl)propionate hydroxylase